MAFGRLASLFVDIVITTRRFQTGLNQAKTQTQNAANSMRNSLTKVGLAASAFLLVKKAVNVVTDAVISSTLKFAALEKQIVDIQKVAKFSNFQDFAQGFIQLGTEMRGVSFKELGDIGGDLARLGVRGGAKEFLEFLKVSAQFASSTGDLNLRQAGEGIGKLLQNFGKELNAVNALAASSSINKLADDFAVTSGEILIITQKLSGFADAIGLSQEQTLGLVTLIKQTGISSTVVESTLTRLFILLESEPQKVGEVLKFTGQQIEDFTVKLKAKPIEAVREFFGVLHAMPIEEAVAALKELQISNSRTAVGIMNATNRFDDWNKTQRAASEGAGNAASLLDKVAMSAETAADKIEQLKNRWDAFLAGLGNTAWLDFINGLMGEITPDRLNVAPNVQNNDKRTTRQKYEDTFNEYRKIKKEQLNDSVIGVFPAPLIDTKGYYARQGARFAELENLAARRKLLSDQIIKEEALKKNAANEAAKASDDQITKERAARVGMSKEYTNNWRKYNASGGDFLQEENKLKSMREGFEHRLKEEKKKYAGSGSAEVHAQLEIDTERKIAEATAKIKDEARQKELDADLKAADDLYQHVDEILKKAKDKSNAVISFGLGQGVGGRTGDMINNLLRFKELEFNNAGLRASALDMLLNPKFAPEIRGLDAAYRDAITQKGDVDERAVGFLEELVKEFKGDKEIQTKILEAIKGIKIKAPVI